MRTSSFWRSVGQAARPAGQFVQRVGTGHWTRYTVFAGTNTTADLGVILSALVGRVPISDGPAIETYERRFAEAAGTTYAFSFASGRMALYTLLKALGVGPGDEVIVPAFTCVVVPNAILYCGAKPVFVDIEPDTFNIAPTLLEEKITPRTKVIIAQHTFGLVSDVSAATAIAARHGIVVLEDCAHALGATLDGRPAGSLTTAAFFSTDHTKLISTGAGGMVTTNDAGVASRVGEIYRNCPFLPIGRVRRLLGALAGEIVLLHPKTCQAGRYLQAVLGSLGLRQGFFSDELLTTRPHAYPYPARLSNAQAAIGIRQLATLADNVSWRRNLASLFDEELGLSVSRVGREARRHVFLRYSFLVADRHAWERHFDAVLDMNPWYTSVVHGRSDESLHEVGYQRGACPIAEDVAAHCVNLPTHLRVREPEILLQLLRAARQSHDPALRLRPPTRCLVQ
jgi:dTDP-4-amino-4,6-dideoxygalactose transaminase